MPIHSFLNQAARWLRGGGESGDVVISSRVRLARNIAGFPFLARATLAERQQIKDMFRNVVTNAFDSSEVIFVELESTSPMTCQYLHERQLISRELAEMEGSRGVLVHRDELFSVMVTEEDHLRIQAMTSGLELHQVWEIVGEVDDRLEEHIDYAFHERYGYLTACPTNTGTGMRVSVMLHLPALVLSKEIEKVFRSLQKVNLAVRGIYGEGSQALGDFFQISNQVTLGYAETDLLAKVGDIIPQIIAYERQARDFLIAERQEALLDQCHRAFGQLRSARTIGMEEAMRHLSSLRLAFHLRLIDGIDLATINDLLLHIQPAHLAKLKNLPPESPNEPVARAEYLRTRLNAAGE
ncbi:MAG: protein arginine kinase [Thermoguttaceae bacterium]